MARLPLRTPGLSIAWLLPALATAATVVVPASALSASGTGGTLGCRRSDRGRPGRIWPAEVRPEATKTLVPQGADSLRVCDYTGLNATRSTPQFGLAGAGVTTGQAVVARIATEFDEIRRTAKGAILNCPAADGSQEVLSFRYRSGPSVVLSVSTNGCKAVTNDHISMLALDTAVLGRVDQLVKPVALTWSTVVGHLRLCGGPAPSRCHVEDYDGANEVVAINSSNRDVATAQIHRGGFRFKVAAPGAYRFELIAGSRRIDATFPKIRATLTVGHTTRVVFPISIF